jgi:hypothetical protein
LEAYAPVAAATYSAKAGDCLVGVNFAGAVTITLPTAQLRKGRVYTVKDESGAAATNNITVATEGSETIDGSATDVISDNYGSKTYYSDGSNWFTVPLLAVGSHSLASHSSEAHSELSGVGTDDHHAKAHQAEHNSGGADALKLDDLSAPDDNTDLDFSTTAHGLVPKGTNTGDFLKDDGSWAAASGAQRGFPILPGAITGTGVFPDTINTYAVAELGNASSDGAAFFTFEVPADFSSLVGLTIRVASNGTGTLRYNVASRAAGSGDDKDSNTDTIAATDLSVTDNQLAEIDISAVLTAIAAGQTIGIQFTREGSHANDTITDLKVFAIMYEYN